MRLMYEKTVRSSLILLLQQKLILRISNHLEKMKKLLIALASIITVLSCGQRNRTQITEATSSDETAYETSTDTTSAETLNDIRFEGWTTKDWADNEYIREVRRYIDAYNTGQITDPNLDEYKEFIQGKFVIGDINPGLWGGAFMYILFFDHPDKMFSVLVYSDVDEEKRSVSNYKCMGLKLEDSKSGFTQTDIIQFLKQYPEHKLW